MSVRGLRAALMLCCVLATGCVTPPPSEPADEAVARLEAALLALDGAAESGEAKRIAQAALDAAAELRTRYRPLRPAVAGNFAFYLGLRERALCCHYVEDLLRRLSELALEDFALHWGVAHRGSELREHSALVVVPRGRAFADGLVLDAWRNSGRLYWSRVAKDRYPWQLHPSDAERHRLACRASRSE